MSTSTDTRDVDATDHRERLREAAADRWGDEWRIVAHEWADGTEDIFAEHICGIVKTDDSSRLRERVRLFLDRDGQEAMIRRERYHGATVIAEETEPLN